MKHECLLPTAKPNGHFTCSTCGAAYVAYDPGLRVRAERVQRRENALYWILETDPEGNQA